MYETAYTVLQRTARPSARSATPDALQALHSVCPTVLR